jgi:amino acid transporter
MEATMISEKKAPGLLDRILKGFDLTTLYFALIFGSYGAAQMTADGWAGIPMLLLAAVTFLLPTALGAYELGTLFPGEGGIYIWAHKALGPLHGFISGWLSWIPIFFLMPLGASTIVAHFQLFSGMPFSLGTTIALQVAIVIAIALISCLRLVFSQRYINIMFFVSMATAVIVFACATSSGKHATPLDASVLDFNVLKHGAMYSAAILWLLGVEVPFNMGDEIKDTKKSAGIMLLYGTIALLIAYIIGIAGVLLILPVAKINAITGVADAVKTVSPYLGLAVAGMVCFAVSSQDVAYMNAYSRLLFVSGLDKRMPPVMSYQTSKKVPIAAILVQCIGGVLVVIFFSTQQNLAATFQLYIASLIVVWVASLFYLLIALPIVRRKYASYYTNTSRVWRIPGGAAGLWLTVIAGVIFNFVAIYYVFANPFTADMPAAEWRKWLICMCVIVILAGLLIYGISERLRKREGIN